MSFAVLGVEVVEVAVFFVSTLSLQLVALFVEVLKDFDLDTSWGRKAEEILEASSGGHDSSVGSSSGGGLNGVEVVGVAVCVVMMLTAVFLVKRHEVVWLTFEHSSMCALVVHVLKVSSGGKNSNIGSSSGGSLNGVEILEDFDLDASWGRKAEEILEWVSHWVVKFLHCLSKVIMINI
jgi:hypothetical protein